MGGVPLYGAPAAATTLVIDKSLDVQTADPGRDNTTTGRMLFHAVYDTLLTFNTADVSKPDPMLAESYTVSKDAKTFTFVLRQGAVFSDGTPVTSADVVFSFNRLRNLRGGAAYLAGGLTVTASDPRTVVLTSEKPNLAVPYLLTNPSLSVLNSKVVIANGGTDAANANQADRAQAYLNDNSVGSGRYVIERFSTSDQIVLRANPRFWGTKPTYARIVMRNVIGLTQRLDVMQGSTQVALDIPPDQLSGLREQGLQVVTGRYPTVWYFQANANPAISAVTSNRKFREAIRYGLDYKSMVELGGPGARQACGIVSSLFPGGLPDRECVQRNLGKAREALQSSGLSQPTAGLEYPSDISINGLQFRPIAERIKAQLAEVGINIELRPAPLGPVLERWVNGRAEMTLWSTSARFPHSSHYLIFIPGRASAIAAGWPAGTDAQLEALGARAETATTADEMARVWRDIQRRMVFSDAPYFPFMESPRTVVAAKGVSNVFLHPTYIADIAGFGAAK
jgi:peptide/nickel transport system substrate-binding protein